MVYAFAGSGCVENNGFSPAAILAYDLMTNTTTVYGDIPKAVYAEDKGAATGPVFGTGPTPFLDASRGGAGACSTSSPPATWQTTNSRSRCC